MTEAAIRQVNAGELQLSGVIDYQSGAALRKEGHALIKASEADELVVDCSTVEKSSSVGLSLLLAFTRDANATGKLLKVRGLPRDMQQIAQVCGLTQLLALV